MDTSAPVGKAMFGMLAIFAEFERAIAYERTMAGLAAARAAGKKGGRVSAVTDDEVLPLVSMLPEDAAKKLKMSVPGFRKRLAVALKNAEQRRANDV